ncbi:MAG: helix-hairpin-helix domain-containing protein [Clostridia bacterium]|nr:helix-hairpin-helix domain-containing protein [Clostridia bacterium]
MIMTKGKKDELLTIPGVGKSIMRDMHKLGIYKIEDLKGKNPDEMYDLLSSLQGNHLDRCMLYVFRCAVYYAENDQHEPELLKWWNWKEKK